MFANLFFLFGCVLLITSTTTRTGATAAAPQNLNNDRDQETLIHPADRFLKPKPKNFQPTRPGEDTSEFWINAGKTYLTQQLNKEPNTKIAKNVILFMADGMSVATLAAARVNLGGEEKQLFFESFPSRGLSKTYCVSNQVPDSSSTSTAYLCGVKTNYGVVGVNARVPRYNCTAQLDESTLTPSIAKWAQDAGKSTGFVTTTRVTDASPAGVFSHAANRYWENNQKVLDDKCDPTKIKDLAHQLVYGDVGSKLKVILGGGRREFRDKKMADEERHSNTRTDGRDLIQEWKDTKIGANSSYVWHANDLRAVNANETEYLLGMFEGTHMMYRLDAIAAGVTDSEPTLSEMVDKAIDILNRNENGFFLFVEGGRVDHGHHGTRSRLAVDETTEYAKAIELAKSKLGDDTLIVVTADHSHTMTYGGYDYRGGDIFGTAFTEDVVQDGLPYTKLTYVDGPGFESHMPDGIRLDLSEMDKKTHKFRFPAQLPRSTESHGGEDVTIHATGPWAHLFTGVMEQNTIPHIMAFASCIGKGRKACDLY